MPSKDIYFVYDLLYKDGLVSFPITSDAEHKIGALVANIESPHFGEEIYKTPEEKAVAYLYFIIKDHAFTDGNKRTACLVFAIVCSINELTPVFGDFSLDELAVYLEEEDSVDHQELIYEVTELLFPEQS